MNKKILAVSVAAALSAGASVAQAQAHPATGNTLVVPYYSVQNGDATLINIVNTDTQKGKAVKVRFRGAEHSDDVFDFQVFLSPGDMWTANVSQAADGRATLTTNDNSCTLPEDVNLPFVTSRLTGTDAEKAASTREGYVEIINMGDVIETNVTSGTNQDRRQQELFTAVKHKDGVAPCTGTVLRSVVKHNAQNAVSTTGLEAGLAGLTEAAGHGRLSSLATGGLFANVTIINVNEASSWGLDAFAFNAGDITRYWSQVATPFAGALAEVTLDGIFLSGATAPAQYDFPDLSTPRATGTPYQQYQTVNAAIGNSTGLANEFITADSIFAQTDWVLSMPTRRYAIEGRVLPATAPAVQQLHADDIASLTTLPRGGAIAASTSYAYLPPFANQGTAGVAPFATSYSAANNCVTVASFTVYDREENTATSDVVISPGEPTKLRLCGEVGVVSFNNAGATTSAALGAELTLNDADIPYVDGWATISLAAPGGNLPVIGNAFIKANNGGSGAANMNFGAVWPHRPVTVTP